MAPDRPTPRVSQSLEASGKQNSLAAYARIAGRDSRHTWRRDRRCRGDCRSRLQRRRGQEQLFTPADAARIANVRPVMPGWTWPENPKKHVSSGSQTDAPSTDPLDVELRRHTADLVSLGDAANKWEDADKLANLYVQVFASAAEAHRLMAPFNAYSRGWGRRFGRITKDEEGRCPRRRGLARPDGRRRGRGDIPLAPSQPRCRSTFSASGSAKATLIPPHVPGSTQSTRPREQARRG